MTIHIGQVIRQRMEQQGKTVSWLARQYGCSRVNMYKIFDKPSIDTAMLMRFSLLLDYDFFACYSQELARKQNKESML